MSQDLPIERVMQTGLLFCEPNTPLCEAAALMAKRRCSSILVTERDIPVGIWTEHDALAVDFADPEAVRQPIATVMSSPVASLHRATTLGEAAMQLNTQGYRHFLVVDSAGKAVGILSQSDVALNQGIEPYLRLREVHSAMRKQPTLLPGDMLLSQAVEQMRRYSSDAAVVACRTDDGKDELGIVTERDLVSFIANHPGNTPVGTLASQPLLTVDRQALLIHARDLLIDHRVRHLAVLDSDGSLVGLLGFSDILAGAGHHYLDDLRTALEQRDQALLQSRQNLQLAERVIDASLEGIIITDPHNRIEFVNPAFTHLTGYQPAEVIGRTPAVLSSGRHDAQFYHEMWQELQRHGYWRGEIWNRRKDGELYLQRLTITAINDEADNISHYAALFTDITQLRENEERVRRLAYYDALTGLPNRRKLEDQLELAIHHAQRHDQSLAVIFIDLDHFKQVNDTLGHAVGDELLLKVSERIRRHLREDDTLARLGGDEFLLLLPELTELDDATRVARRLIETVSDAFVIDGHEFRVGCSLGISLFPDDGVTPEVLVKNADAAMYRAKQQGRNTYRLYRAEKHEQDHQTLALETALRNSVETGEGLTVHYQPLIDRDSGKMQHAEALLRWSAPDFGDISPDEFIPLAERSGLISPLGQRAMQLVASQLQAWLSAGLSPPRVAINLSARQFWQEDLIDQVRALFTTYDLPAGQIGFELTESVLLEYQQQAVSKLAALRELGCWLALDDFGTGYSSLSYLQDLPLTAIKIDSSFIQQLDGDKRRGSAAIIAAITTLAKALGLSVVAEGVETEAQLATLSSYPIDQVQGYLTGPALNAADFEHQWLALPCDERV